VPNTEPVEVAVSWQLSAQYANHTNAFGMQWQAGPDAASEEDIIALTLWLQANPLFTDVQLSKTTLTNDVLFVDLSVPDPNFDPPAG
jgi:hypothetical protein